MKAVINLPMRLYQSSRQVTVAPSGFTPITQHIRPITHSPVVNWRQYSTAIGGTQEGSSPQEKPATSETEAPAKNPAVDPANKELEASRREIIDLKDKYLRSVADYRNLQDRTKREVSAARDFAISKFARDLLDSVDNLDRALTTVPESAVKVSAESGATEAANQDLVNLFDGLKMTEKILMQTLAKHGLERYDPTEKGDKFDPNLHDASFMAPVKDKENGTVFTTIQKGFLLNGRVVRAAKVGVVKNS